MLVGLEQKTALMPLTRSEAPTVKLLQLEGYNQYNQVRNIGATGNAFFTQCAVMRTVTKS